MSRWSVLILFFAGLAGAAGLITAPAAAHVNADPLLNTAATVLQIHAAAAIGVIAHAGQQRDGTGFRIAASLLILGACLFGGDLIFHVWSGSRLFPMAAPTGGSLMIIGWFIVAVTALIRLVQLGKRGQSVIAE